MNTFFNCTWKLIESGMGCLGVCGMFLGLFVLSPVLKAEGNTPPNILFVIADDWSVHAGAYGTPWVKTPSFDRLASDGLLFRNAFTPAAKCATSRASILTGRHIWQLEEAGNHMSRFPAKFKVWPEVLHQRGWYVGMTGKGWGPGVANDSDGKSRLMTGKPMQSRKLKPPTTAISNNDYAANFTDFLDQAPAGKPWCFWLGTLEPHRDYEFKSGVLIGGKSLSEINDLPKYWPDHEVVRHDMLDYALEVEHNDRQLGRVVAELEKRELLSNTLIIVTSDHGMPFPRVKGYAYFDSNHVPLAIHYPKGIHAPGRVIDDFVSFVDIAATLLDYAGIAASDSGMAPMVGESWRPIIESDKVGQVMVERDHVLVGKERTDVGRPLDQGYPVRGILTAKYLYLRNFEPTRWPAGNPETGYLDTDGSPTKSYILELGRKDRTDLFWKWNFGIRPSEELYSLPEDTDCLNNLAGQEASRPIVSELSKRLLGLLTAQNDPRMLGKGDVFDRYVPTNGAGFYEDYMQGKMPKAGWVNPEDFESGPIGLPPQRE